MKKEQDDQTKHNVEFHLLDFSTDSSGLNYEYVRYVHMICLFHLRIYVRIKNLQCNFSFMII